MAANKTNKTQEHPPPVDSRVVDDTYLGWPRHRRQRFLDRVNAHESAGLDIETARNQAFWEEHSAG